MSWNEALDHIGKFALVAAERPAWRSFAEYLRLRAIGMRQPALRSLAEFVESARQWPLDARKELLLWVDQQLFWTHTLGLPAPLLWNVIQPTATEWLEREPNSAEANYCYGVYMPSPFVWGGPLDHLRRAVELDPLHEGARRTFIRRVLQHAANSQHELPRSPYLGSVSEDIADLAEGLGMARSIEDPSTRQELTAKLEEVLEIARAWEAFEQAGQRGNFEDWCIARGGPREMLP